MTQGRRRSCQGREAEEGPETGAKSLTITTAEYTSVCIQHLIHDIDMGSGSRLWRGVARFVCVVGVVTIACWPGLLVGALAQRSRIGFR